jgi:hypothetical protein
MRRSIRLGLTGALLLIALGSVHGCKDPVSVGVDDPPPGCVLIDGVLYCP